MTKQEVIKYLRNSVNIQDPEVVTDSAYISLSDEDIELYANIVLMRDFPDIPSLDYLTNEMVYPVVLLAKKEMYFALATISAPDYRISADGGGELDRQQRFEHYMALIEQIDKEYDKYTEDGGLGTNNTLTSYDVLLSNRYYTKRNYEKSAVPTLSVFIDSLDTDEVLLRWKTNISRFKEARIYVSSEQIYDSYKISTKGKTTVDVGISPSAKLVATVKDPKHTKCRLEGLTPETLYHIAVSVIDISGVFNVTEIEVTTLSETVIDVGNISKEVGE